MQSLRCLWALSNISKRDPGARAPSLCRLRSSPDICRPRRRLEAHLPNLDSRDLPA